MGSIREVTATPPLNGLGATLTQGLSIYGPKSERFAGAAAEERILMVAAVAIAGVVLSPLVSHPPRPLF